MVDPELVRKKLQKLDEYLGILREAQRYSREQFESSAERYGSVERFLHLAIEVLNDLGNHVIADEGLGRVEAYRDIPRLLAENARIDTELRDNWLGMIGFRNVLVHDYAEIDRGIVFDVLQSRLEDLVLLRDAFAKLL